MASVRTEILDVVATVSRKRWLALAVAWLVCIIGWTMVTLLPDKYGSETRLYVDTDSLLGPLLKNLAIENDLARQVQIMQRTLLSRPNLQKVIASTDLALQSNTRVEEQNLFDKLERSTVIHADGPNLFTIRYFDSNPVLARDVVQSFVTILMENNAGQNRTDMEKARNFIEKQIANYEVTLKTIEQRMAEFQSRHVEELGSVGSNFSGRLEAAATTTATAQREVDDAVARGDSLAAQLAKIPKFIEVQSAPQVVVNTQTDPLQAHLAQLQSDLAGLRLRYTEIHPDVIATKRALEELQQQLKDRGPLPDGSGGAVASTNSQTSNPVYEQAQMRLLDAQQEVEIAKRHLAQARLHQERLLKIAGSAPVVEAQFNDLKREYGVQKKQYEELLERRESARISEAVQNSSTRIQFRIIEPPNVPVRPAGPKRVLFMAVILGLGIAAGIGAAFLLNHIQDPVTSAEAITKRFGLPVIGEVSLVQTNAHRSRQRRRTWATAFSIASLLIFFSAAQALSYARGGGYQVAELKPYLEMGREWVGRYVNLKVLE